MRFEFKMLLLFILLNVLAFGFYNLGVYFENYKSRKCKILKQYSTDAGYKVRPKFILIVQDVETNHTFDIEVIPTTYYRAETEKYMWFVLSEKQVNPNTNQVLPITFFVLMVISIILVFVLLIYLVFKPLLD